MLKRGIQPHETSDCHGIYLMAEPNGEYRVKLNIMSLATVANGSHNP
jgi:hypothetical protein